MSELPCGWEISSLGIMASAFGGSTPSKAEPRYWAGGNIPWVSPKDMKRFSIGDSEDHVTEAALDRLSIVQKDSVLVVVRSGILSRTLPVAVTTASVTINQDMRAFVPEQGISATFLAWQLIAKERDILDTCSKDGTTVASVEGLALATFPIWLAPYAEQTRIVEKLEELLGGLDAAVTELKAAQRKLTHYRQSLLKAAMEGVLTEAWRSSPSPCPRSGQGEVGRGSLLPSDKSTPPQPSPSPSAKGREQETGAQLLHRILQERRTRWEEKQLAKFAQTGKTPPKGWQAKYPEPVAPDTSELPALPEGWAWATIDQLSLAQKYGSSAKTNGESDGVPVLRMGNIQNGEIELTSLKYLPTNHDQFPDLFLEDGDLLFNRTNSPELVGKTAVYRSQISPCSYASYLIAVRFTELFIPELASAYINSAFGRNWVKSVVVQQVGQANVNGSKLAALAILLPPLEEQTEILATLDTQLSAAKEQETAITHSLHQAAAQRRNLLRAAFSGQLVPQDPNDEPASELLARIRAAKADNARPAAATKRGRKPKGNT